MRRIAPGESELTGALTYHILVHRHMLFSVNASACNTSLLSTGIGQVKHVSTNDLWLQRSIPSYSHQTQNAPRCENASDTMTRRVEDVLETRPPAEGTPHCGGVSESCVGP